MDSTKILTAVAIALAVFAGLAGIRRYIRSRLEKWAEHTSNRWDDIVVVALERTSLLFIGVFAVYIGSRVLELPGHVHGTLGKITFMALLAQIAIWGAAAITRALDDHKGNTRVLAVLIKFVFFSLLFLWGLDNFGVNITALVAGLGIGGIAIALAVQNILGDLFASLTIVLDKPFVIGDFIVVGESMGTIEKIGLKTTRVRSLSGEQLIFPNNDLLKSRIRNFKRMRERRVEFQFRVAHQTDRGVLQRLPEDLRRVVESQKQIRFERAHLKRILDWGLEYEVVYWVTNPEQELFMDIQQRINFELIRILGPDLAILGSQQEADYAMGRTRGQ